MQISDFKLYFKRNTLVVLLLILISLTITITYYKILIQLNIGPPWDTFDFLADAMYFAGKGFGYADMIRPPLIPYLTSLFFRVGFVSEATIFVMDGIIFIIGVLGFYLLLNQRFNEIQSFMGTILFISFPVILLWVGTGYTDVASTSFLIWAIYFTVLSVRKNPKFFCLSFPLVAIAFLTRFTSAIIIFPMILYLLINKGSLKNYKYISVGIVGSLLIMIPVFLFFNQIFGDPFFPFLNAYGTSSGVSTIEVFAFNSDPFFYISNSIYGFINMNFISCNSIIDSLMFLILIFLLISSIFGIITYMSRVFRSKREVKNFKSLKSKHLQISIFIILSIIFLITLNNINYLLSDLIFVLLCLMIYKFLKNENLNFLDIDFLFLAWLISFLIFYSFYQVKVYRYFIPMAPALIYFIILGWDEFSSNISLKIRNTELTKILSILFVICLLFSSFSFLYQLKNDPLTQGFNFKIDPEKQNQKYEITGKPNSGYLYFETNNIQELKKVMNWLKDYDPDYENKTIYSDYFWPQLSWYLKTYVRGIPNQKNLDLNYELKRAGADYYINIAYQVRLDDFIKIGEFKTNFGNVIVYKRSY